ncbi:MAG: hypothetical protein NUV61_04350 [Candidatus Azambacteria bacterium]|nr:hypothetical protein [Candidatus Azambacteria bacterium]
MIKLFHEMAGWKKIVVYVPLTHADALRTAIGEAGGGTLGNYSFCSFSVRGVGRFRPDAGASPHIGEVGKIEQVEEERIEVTCAPDVIGKVIAAIKAVHPYEEIALDVYALENW